MAVAYVGGATGTTSATIPSGAANGNLILIFAYNGTSTTVPTLPTNFISITTNTGNSNAFRIGYRWAYGNSGDISGTWTNATALTCVVYSGVSAVGAAAGTTSVSGLTTNITGLTLQNTSGSSWVAAFGGSNQTTSMSTPAGTSLRETETAAATMAIAVDSNAGVTSWALHTSTNGTAAVNAGVSVELLAGNAPITPRAPTTINTGSSAANSLVINAPTGLAQNDFMLMTLSVNNGSSCTITTLAGWTLLNRTNNTTVLGQGIYYKVAGASEPSTYTWSFTSEFASATLVAYPGVDPNNPLAGFTALGKTSASTSATFTSTTPKCETAYAVLAVTGRNTTASTTISTASTGYVVDASTCTTATDFIMSAILDEHIYYTLPLIAQSPGSATFSTSSTDVNTMIFLRPSIAAATTLTTDVTQFTAQVVNGGTAAATVTTGYSNEIIVVYADSDNTNDVITIAGAGLTWNTSVANNVTGTGTNYLFWATATSPLTAQTITVTSTLSAGLADMRIYVMTFINGNTSGPIGATQNGATSNAVFSTNVVTTGSNSWVWAGLYIGGDDSSTITAGSAQAIVGSNKDTNDVEMSWMQQQNALTATSGTTVTMNNTSPSGDNIMYIAFEILAGSGGGVNVSISQTHATLTFTGGTQSVATINDVAVAQSAATLTFSGGTQVVQTNGIVAQSVANLTFTGGTQAVATINIVAVSQSAATLTFSGGTQQVVTLQTASVSQSAATLTFTGGTQAVAALVDASVAQSAATLTLSGGTQSVTTVNDVAITQTHATLTFTGGTQAVVSVNYVSVSQQAAILTFTGGTQVSKTNTAITQSAASLTFTGGLQVVATVRDVSVSQVAATLTFTGGTQAVTTAQSISISQVGATLTFNGGTQSIVTTQSASVTQSHASLTFTGGTQSFIAMVDATIAQRAATLTFTGGTQTVVAQAETSVLISQSAATLLFTGGTQIVTPIIFATLLKILNIFLNVPDPIALSFSVSDPIVISTIMPDPIVINLSVPAPLVLPLDIPDPISLVV